MGAARPAPTAGGRAVAAREQTRTTGRGGRGAPRWRPPPPRRGRHGGSGSRRQQPAAGGRRVAAALPPDDGARAVRGGPTRAAGGAPHSRSTLGAEEQWRVGAATCRHSPAGLSKVLDAAGRILHRRRRAPLTAVGDKADDGEGRRPKQRPHSPPLRNRRVLVLPVGDAGQGCAPAGHHQPRPRGGPKRSARPPSPPTSPLGAAVGSAPPAHPPVPQRRDEGGTSGGARAQAGRWQYPRGDAVDNRRGGAARAPPTAPQRTTAGGGREPDLFLGTTLLCSDVPSPKPAP